MRRRKVHADTAIGYVRVSTVEQAGNGHSLAAQKERIRAYAEMMNLKLVDVVAERGVSASIPFAKRTGGAKLLERAHSERIGNIVAFKLDRVFRSVADATSSVTAWQKQSVALHLLDFNGQAINTASATGGLIFHMLAAVAEFERKLTAERNRETARHLKANGRVCGKVPYGHDRHGNRLVKNTTEQRTIRQILRWRSKEWSYQRIADALNAKGIPTKNNARKGWQAATVFFVYRGAAA